MLQLMNGLKIWQVGILLTALVLGAGVAYGAYVVVVNGWGDASLSEDEQLIQVIKGDLVTDVSISGSLVFPIREMLGFGTTGKVSQVLVEEGQSVNQGQQLATLDDETIATLNKVIAQNQVSVRDAKEALAEARVSATKLELAQAEANVADTRLAHEASLKALAEARSPITELELELAQAKANVADAKLAHKASQKTLSELLQPPAQDLAEAAVKVANAKVSLAAREKSFSAIIEVNSEAIAQARNTVVASTIALEDAQGTLVATLSGPSDVDVAKAQLKVDSAGTTLANAHREKKITVSEWDDKIKVAEDTLAAAVESYGETFFAWFGIALDRDQQYQDPDALLTLFGIDIERLFDPDSRYSDMGLWINWKGLPPDDPETVWNETTIYSWLNLHPGTIYPTCSNDNLPAKDPCVRQELDDGFTLVQQTVNELEMINTSADKAVSNSEITVSSSESGLSTALLELEDLIKEPDPLRIELLETDIVIAQTALDTAVEQLASLISGPDEVDVEAEQTKVALAKTELDIATEELSSLISGPDVVDLEAERTKVALAKAHLDTAEQDLQDLIDDPDPIALEVLEKQVALTSEKLKAAVEDLAEFQEGPDPLVVALRETDLAVAQTSLDSALDTLVTLDITAPWDGVISAVNIDIGQNVNLDTRAIEIINPTVIEVDGAVDEIDVLYLREGAAASITMDALPGQTLAGSVSEIDVQSTNQQGVVTYEISIRLDTNGLQLPAGLTAVASVILREDNDVLLIPLDALYGTFENPLVRVSSNGQVEERPVELGNTDDFWVVVTSGIAEAELVVMKSQQAETSSGWGGFSRGFGGGFGGTGSPSRSWSRGGN